MTQIYPEGSEVEETQLPVLTEVVRIIKMLRSAGSLTPGELEEKTPRKTFYRAVKALQESGIVVWKDGKYYWYQSFDTRFYRTEFEAKLALDHSVNLASGLKSLLGIRTTSNADIQDASGPQYRQLALSHLRTGYEEISAFFQKSERAKKNAVDLELDFEKEIQDKIHAFSLQTNCPEIVAKIVMSDLKEILRGREPYFLNDLQVQGETVKSGAYQTLAKKEQFDLAKQFMSEQENSNINREICSEIVRLENRYFDLRQKLVEKINVLLMQVENGTSLRGSCDLCSKIRIGDQDDEIEKAKRKLEELGLARTKKKKERRSH
jgi:hypothetical protein